MPLFIRFKERTKENDNQKQKITTEKFMGIYNQLNLENRRKVDQMIIMEYMEQVNEVENLN